MSCVAITTHPSHPIAWVITRLWSMHASHIFSTQIRQCIAKPGLCEANCDAIPGKSRPAPIHPLYVLEEVVKVIAYYQTNNKSPSNAPQLPTCIMNCSQSLLKKKKTHAYSVIFSNTNHRQCISQETTANEPFHLPQFNNATCTISNIDFLKLHACMIPECRLYSGTQSMAAVSLIPVRLTRNIRTGNR